MKNIIRKYIRKMDKGLFLLDAPTGYGKTTAVVEYIKDFLVNSYDDAKRIFFITHLKKNLPIAKMKELLGEDVFNRECLYLQPYFENVIDNWQVANITDEEILKSEQYARLNTAISNIYDLKKNDSKENKKYIKNIESHIEKELEPKFRELIKGLRFYKKMSSEKRTYIQKNKWIQILYPTTILERYKAVFTSTNKFCFPLDVFHKLPFHIYNDPILDNSIVFIDEFDSNKDTLLNSIIEDGLKLKIDVIKLFVHIYYALNNLSIPKEILKTSKEIKERIDSKKYYSTEEIISQNKEKFNSLYEKYKFNYLIKTRDIKEDKAFLFSDGNYVTITKDNSKKQFFSKIEQETANQRIVFSGYGRNSKFDKVQDIIEEVVDAIDYFSIGVLWISKNYQSYKNESRSIESNYYTIEEAIRSTLSIFNISDEFIDYLFELITAEKFKKSNNKADENENNFMRNGLSFLEVEDSDYHDMQSIFHMFKFNLTPEEVLLKTCKKAKVVGISATATLKTVIGNFDLNHIEKKLRNDYFIIEPEDDRRLKEDFDSTQIVYEQKHVDINVNVVDDYPALDQASICEKLIRNIFFEDKRNKYLNYLKELEYDNIYYFLIVLKIAYSYKNFAENFEMKSFICFLNGLPKQMASQKKFTELVQEDILEVLKDVSPEEIKTFFIRSNNFDENMSVVYEGLNTNKKCFVITTYQTLGTGKNIQYDIPDGIEKNMIIQDKEKKQKDFDGIYLLTPTNLIQNINVKQSQDKYKELSRFLFQQEYLYVNKDNHYYIMLNNIRNAFKRLFFGDVFAPINIKNGDLFKNNARIIIQAVGRICRCKNKNKTITIITDSEIIQRLHDVEDDLSKRLLNKEFEQLLKTDVKAIELPLDELSEKNNSISYNINIQAYRVRDSIENNLRWKKLRNLALKFPTYDGIKKELDSLYFTFGFKVRMYAYKLSNKKKFEKISFQESYNYKQVSMFEARLNILKDIPFIKDKFEENQFKLHFDKAEKIMSVAFFQQIYLGALGEIVGKIILEHEIGCDLEEIEDYSFYEFFDFKIGNIYIDFKNWHYYQADNETYVKKVLDKLNKINGTKALIINIFKIADGKKYIDNLPQNIRQIPWLINPKTNEIDIEQVDNILSFLD